YNLTRFVITDKYGNRAGGGGDLVPGSGQGSLSCCYTLKGTEFNVKWELYDADEALKDIYGPIEKFPKETTVHLPATKIEGDLGMRVLGLHFYPDDHVEFEFRTDLRGTRIEYFEIWDWLMTNHEQLLNPDNKGETSVMYRRTARLVANGWLKHRFTDTKDLQQYVYYTLLNPKFDEHPTVRKIIAETKEKLGAFGNAMENLPAPVIEQLKRKTVKRKATGKNHG
ncbi:hypothetical protein, partial [Cupriavidus sp. DL-D2]|uniref:hypothetical protein n=1 Tax=Cupriavidus sp. DL-D2 TaxID=3144974 RepID=UPI00321276B9